MSTRRILWITIFGIAFIAILIVAVLLSTYSGLESSTVILPETSETHGTTSERPHDALDRVEITIETIQAVVAQSLVRPESYNRSLTITSFWDGGQSIYSIDVNAHDGFTSLRTLHPSGDVRHVIITPRKLYIWYDGDTKVFSCDITSGSNADKVADEWQMMVTYEDILTLEKNAILDAGYTEYYNAECVYVMWFSPLLGYTRKCYISLELGLIVGAEEYDGSGMLIYEMTTDTYALGEPDTLSFILPGGINTLDEDSN